MSTLEKSLYQQTKVAVGSKKDNIYVKSPTYKGFSTADGSQSSNKLYDIALIKQDIINHFHIRQGENLSNPQFGTIIWDILYEPLTETLKQIIIDNVTDVINYDPRIRVNTVTIDQYESGLQIEAEVIFLTYNIVEKMQFTFDQNNGFLNT